MEKTGKKKSAKLTVINIIITAVFAFVYYYVQLPAINLKNPGFYAFFFIVALIYIVLSFITRGLTKVDDKAVLRRELKTHCLIPIIICAFFLAVIIVGYIVGAPIFRAHAYSSLLSTETSDFARDVNEISFDKIPMLDSDSASALANRKLGELSDLVSQFEVDSSSAQINYKDKPVRISYLNYGDFFKWFNNNSEGIPAYITLDMVSQDATVIRLDQGMKYSPSEYFFRDLNRYLRFSYPTLMFDDVNLEVDDNGVPYWVASVITKRIGLFGGTDVKGAVLLNSVTGESAYYDVADVPTWVDRVFSADLIIQQYDYYGKYHNGFVNSMFGQSDVTVTTQGYNYIAQDDDVWLYTGITSVGGDESNIGFILVNQRTKESKYYSIAGAEEFSAMSSAEGAVQQFGYKATFPLLLNISDQPTYFMALKDSSSLVKMYAMVNVQQYQIFATGATVALCEQNYVTELTQNNIISGDKVASSDIPGIITDLRYAVVEGNTYAYIELANSGVYYVISVSDCPLAAVISIGDRVIISCSSDEGDFREAYSLKTSD